MIVSLLLFVGLPIIFFVVLMSTIFHLIKSFAAFVSRLVMLVLLVLFAGLYWRFSDVTSLDELPELGEAWGQLGSQILPPLIDLFIFILELVF